MARVPTDATAFAHRDRRIMANVAALSEQPEEEPTHEAWVTALHDELRSDTPGAYVNFLGDEGEARVQRPTRNPTWERLARIKAAFRTDERVPSQPEHPARTFVT